VAEEMAVDTGKFLKLATECRRGYTPRRPLCPRQTLPCGAMLQLGA
jgi:hypothetical protein